MNEDTPYNLVYNPEGQPMIAYDVSGRFLESGQKNYNVDYSVLPNIRDRDFVRNYLSNIRTTYQGYPSLLSVNLYRDLSNINNEYRDLSNEQKDRRIANIRNQFINTLRNYERDRQSNERTAMLNELFGGGVININEIDPELNLGEFPPPAPEYIPNAETFSNMFNRIVQPTSRRIADNTISNRNIERVITQQERNAIRRLQGAVRRYNQLAR